MKKKVTMIRIYQRSVRYRISNLIFAVICIGLLVFEVIKADQILTEYESVRYQNAAQDFIASLSEGDYSTLYEYEKSEYGKIGSYGDYAAYVSAAFGSQISSGSWHTVNVSDDEHVYSLALEDGKSISFAMVKNGKSRHGFKTWAVSEIRAQLIEANTITIRIPETSTLKVDGRKVRFGRAVRTGLSGRFMEAALSESERINECEYEISYYFDEPQISVTDSRGRTQKLENVGGILTALYNDDDDMYASYAGSCIAIMKKLSDFTVGIIGKNTLNNDVLSASHAAYLIDEYSKWGSAAASQGNYSLEKCEHFAYISESRFCCEVSAHFVCSYKELNDTEYDIHYMMFFELEGDKPMLFDFYAL